MHKEYLNEVWKDIKGYEGQYQVSNYGRIRNLKTGLDVRQSKHKGGYLKITLYLNGVPKYYLVHRLVAIAFLPNPHNYKFVNHKNEIKTDNRVENLEWCSFEYNVNYGTGIKRRSSKMVNGKLSKPVLQYNLEGNLIKEWPSLSEIKRTFGFETTNISACCLERYKQAYGYIWKYKN